MYQRYYKRIIDVALSSVALLVLWPILTVMAVLVRKKLGCPVIFCQERPGKGGQIFKMYKFRSMLDARDENGELLPDEMRLTEFGKKLRATSMDELPELWNILKGDMSIIGPRPLAKIYLPYYTEEESHRHDVRPGLTGLAQVNGRNNLSWEEKFMFDVEYVNNVSFIMDVKIFAKTIKKVLLREGIGQAEEAPVSLHLERAEKGE